MSSGKHTPGPWKVVPDVVTNAVEMFEIAEVSHLRIVCDGRGDGFSVAGTPDADARLIAAAPELLEAAKLVIAWCEAEDDHSKADFYQRMEMCRQSEAACRAAIAKATGATNV